MIESDNKLKKELMDKLRADLDKMELFMMILQDDVCYEVADHLIRQGWMKL